ncbi:MAG: hypothetical protein K8R90_04200 [Candidatus Cloacimonetes bacterium]|nr:hypothetical protein [Candidatus Cloacimonadota bacterium]
MIVSNQEKATCRLMGYRKRNMKYTLLSIIVLLVFLTGCSTFTISRVELIQQLEENQNKIEVFQFIPVGGSASMFLSSKYQSNQIKRILCYGSDGNKVYLLPNNNTVLEIKRKSDGKVVKMYFDTVFLVGNKIVGLRSRIITSLVGEVAIDDIEKIEIYVEFPRTEPFIEE